MFYFVSETYRSAERVGLHFPDIVITSMVQGKKVMHLPGQSAFDYFPGETVLAPADTTMEIDFPEAQRENPTQCIALTPDSGCVRQAIDFLNQAYPRTAGSWQLNYNHFHLPNSAELAATLNKLVQVCRETSATKDILAA